MIKMDAAITVLLLVPFLLGSADLLVMVLECVLCVVVMAERNFDFAACPLCLDY